jgi:hypothetical protein
MGLEKRAVGIRILAAGVEVGGAQGMRWGNEKGRDGVRQRRRVHAGGVDEMC